MDFGTAIASVTHALELLRVMKDIDKDFDAASYKGRIAELTVALADAKRDLVDARDAVADSQKEIERLKETFRRRTESTVVVRGRRFEKTPAGEAMGMPFCDRCETMDGILIRLVSVIDAKTGRKAICPQCKSDFGNELGFIYPTLA
jgi:hypothetical protein